LFPQEKWLCPICLDEILTNYAEVVDELDKAQIKLSRDRTTIDRLQAIIDAGGEDAYNRSKEEPIVKGGGISKPAHMSDDQWAEFKRTPEYQNEVSRVADPDEPDDRQDEPPDDDLDCDVRHHHE